MDREAGQQYHFFMLVLFVVFTMITVFGVKEMKVAGVEKNKSESNTASFLTSIQLLFENRYFLMMFFLFLALYIFTGVSGTAGIYYATYILGDANMYGLLSIAMMLPMFVGLGIAPKMVEKVGMQKTCIFSAVLFIVGALVMVVSQNILVVVIIGIIIRSIGMRRSVLLCLHLLRKLQNIPS